MTRAIDISYLVAAICFILALKGLSSPRYARYGNMLGAAGMLLAVAMTFFAGLSNEWLIATGMVVGTVIGIPAARSVKMTAIPQMVAIFNGVGGGAAAVVSVAEFLRNAGLGVPAGTAVAVLFGAAVGCVSFSGSAMTFLKLQEVMIGGRPITYPAQTQLNGLFLLAILVLGGYVLAGGQTEALMALAAIALVLGVTFVLPIGGADVPVVISLLNSFTGLAVAASGFVLSNTLLIVAGTLVGASGTLLTQLMSQAMGRPLGNILFGALGSGAGAVSVEGVADRTVRSGTPEDIAIMLAYARKVVIVPGYGLAVAQAQHTIRELADLLEERGVEVAYAIHPVAGRMPGHMNVLLAEANVPYEQLKDMDEVNGEFQSTDVALVVGANDVVNPAARDAPDSPIYGMPILNVDQSRSIVFLKRSMRPGFAGIDNELLYNPKTIMLFGDAKDSLAKLVASVKNA
ncbi:MAG TPA: NAD(P)(+) transhydrogenase (Re/Si-specific) subunit beta [Actinomycetota bacterium]|nr:NAD(P)(+) transhydrogenase (Re/Si-specific) subunit beta [Actinomycetota bacterium]